ncbi:hypothetical protein [Rhodoferax sp. TS-BS-61-7]|uniref:hypothetical protein n=1 Tax=Rhodoferax sp. TS-BS-61-7 TaxID=2094194 RepID=UPI0011B03ADC|nr:hypothetical protein [Rhodoferax sp. TS-BS-61-7]
MQRHSHIKPVTQNGGATMALLNVLSLGSQEITRGKFSDAEEVFVRLDAVSGCEYPYVVSNNSNDAYTSNR